MYSLKYMLKSPYLLIEYVHNEVLSLKFKHVHTLMQRTQLSLLADLLIYLPGINFTFWQHLNIFISICSDHRMHAKNTT